VGDIGVGAPELRADSRYNQDNQKIINSYSIGLDVMSVFVQVKGIEEGCLSIPEQRALVPRAEKVKIRALDRDGKSFELEADGLLAICIQHEMDHLVGKLFIDYLSPLKQQRIRQKVEKLDRLNARA
jgi:peptide deformylase